jgi:hypothetical protein
MRISVSFPSPQPISIPTPFGMLSIARAGTSIARKKAVAGWNAYTDRNSCRSS